MKPQVLVLLFSCMLFTNIIAKSQYLAIIPYTPLELTQKVFSDRGFIDIGKYSVGEYNGTPKAKDFANNLKLKFKLLSENDSAAYVNMTISDSTENTGTDTYIFLVKDSIWKITAFRALAQTTLLQTMLEQYSVLNDRQIDSLVETEKQAMHPNISSKADFKLMIDNIKLTCDLDDNIIKHFICNQSKFVILNNKALDYISNHKLKTDEIENSVFGLENIFRPLLITSIYYTADYIKYSIGGIMDNTVGYIYCADKSKLPQLSANKFILLREIVKGWYLYKTT